MFSEELLGEGERLSDGELLELAVVWAGGHQRMIRDRCLGEWSTWDLCARALDGLPRTAAAWIAAHGGTEANG